MTSAPAAEDTAADAGPAAARRGRPLTLQTRLMVTVIGMVALILVGVALATSTILGRVLQDNLDAKVTQTAQQTNRALASMQFPPTGAPITASDVLSRSHNAPGTALVLISSNGERSGAVIASGGDVQELSASQSDEFIDAASQPGQQSATVDDLGEYRLSTTYKVQDYISIVGLSLSEVQTTATQIITTVALVTIGGLLLLSAAIALVIRAGLKPLRAVAATATRVASQPLAEGAVSITERVPAAEADDRTEIGRVGAALNTLLDHVDTSLGARQRNEERMRRFVADASHELRTPLASIRGYSELSLRDRTLSENTEASLERIQAQSVRMTTLVEDLLLLARLDEGQELVYGSVDLTRIVLEAVGDARPAGPDHTWQLDIGDEPVVIAGDAGRLQQVVANLLANARTHTPAGTTVRVSLGRDRTDAVLRVHDDGPGVDPAVSAELFERFSRADRSRARKTGGTGLGLSIVKAIVDAHGGSVVVDSEPGDTTFIVRLPARPADPAAHAQAEPEIDAADAELAGDEGRGADVA